MRLIILLPVLIAAVSAIDIAIHFNDDCPQGEDNWRMNCVGIAPDTCCGEDPAFGDWPSVSFNWIPRDWVINVRGHNNGWCNNQVRAETVRNTNRYCLRNGGFTGGGYGFPGKKRGVGQPGECTKRQRPDLLVKGGTVYDLVDMEDGLLKELMDIARAGANSSSVPEKFVRFRK